MNTGGKAGGDQAEQAAPSGVVRRTGRFGEDQDPDVGAGTRFKPGQTGNAKGRPKGLTLSKTIQNMLDDDKFIERLNAVIPDDLKKADPEFQGTPMKAIITTAMLKAIQGDDRSREWLAKFGYGTKVDITSDGDRIEVAPVVISTIAARDADVTPPAEAEAS